MSTLLKLIWFLPLFLVVALIWLLTPDDDHDLWEPPA